MSQWEMMPKETDPDTDQIAANSGTARLRHLPDAVAAVAALRSAAEAAASAAPSAGPAALVAAGPTADLAAPAAAVAEPAASAAAPRPEALPEPPRSAAPLRPPPAATAAASAAMSAATHPRQSNPRKTASHDTRTCVDRCLHRSPREELSTASRDDWDSQQGRAPEKNKGLLSEPFALGISFALISVHCPRVNADQ